jgi:hypothetical protein
MSPQTTNWNPPVDRTIEAIDTTVEKENPDKLVINHVKTHTPKYGEKETFVDWKRKEVIVRHNGEVTQTLRTKRYSYSSEKLEEREDFSHTFELADDNETIPHSGKHWEQHFTDQSRKCVNIRWKNLRENKPDSIDPKEAVKAAIESQL